MYSIVELAEMYGCSRTTIYNKLEKTELKPFLVETDTGLKFHPDGINIFNTIMAGSKSAQLKINKKEQDNLEEENKLDYQELYIKELQTKIDYILQVNNKLEKEKQDAIERAENDRKELIARVNFLTDELLNKNKLLESPKGIFKKIFS